MPPISKYGQLPSITVDQTDVYETPDVKIGSSGHGVSSSNINNVTSTCVEPIQVDLERFRAALTGKTLIADNRTDFTDSIHLERGGVCRGYRAISAESRSDKIRRIKTEIRELATTETGDVDEVSSTATPSELEKMVAILDDIQVLDDGPLALADRSSQRLASVDRRLSRLEQILLGTNSGNGVADSSLSVLFRDLSGSCIVDALRTLRYRSALAKSADEALLQRLVDRLDMLGQLQAESGRTQCGDDASTCRLSTDQMARVDELYDMLRDSKALHCTLQTVVGRMENLQQIHSTMQEKLSTLSKLERQAEQISPSLETYAVTLANLRAKMESNEAESTKRLADIESRLSSVVAMKNL